MTHTVPENTAPATVHPHADLIAGLRELADWYEQHPDVPAPSHPKWSHCAGSLSATDEQEYAEVRAVADALGVSVTGDAHRSGATRQFGPVTFKVFHVGSGEMERYNAERAHVKTLTDEQLGLVPVPRCKAAHAEDRSDCEGPADAVLIADATDDEITGCVHHGAVMLAELDGGRVYPGPGSTGGEATEAFRRAATRTEPTR